MKCLNKMAMRHYLLMPDSDKVMKIYKEIKDSGIKATLAPTPRGADACCGVAVLYFNESDKEKIENLIEKTGIEINKFYSCENTENPSRNKFC